MILAAHFDRVLDVSHDVFSARLPALAQERHEIDANHAAFVGQSFELLVVHVTRLIDERAASRMSDGDGCRRSGDCLRDRSLSAMAEIDQHALAVEH
ncbi:MAG TPA: hypothetical protein VF193_11360 [Steroidobacter sp.]